MAPGQIKTIKAPSGRAEAPVAAPKLPPSAEPAEATQEPVVASAKPSLSTSRFADAPRSPRASRIGVGLALGGVVGFGLAGTFGYLASRDFDDARALGCNSDGDCPIGAATELGLQARDRSRFAQVSAVSGGVLLVTGATLWILGRRPTRRAATDVTISVGPSSIGIGWSLK